VAVRFVTYAEPFISSSHRDFSSEFSTVAGRTLSRITQMLRSEMPSCSGVWGTVVSMTVPCSLVSWWSFAPLNSVPLSIRTIFTVFPY